MKSRGGRAFTLVEMLVSLSVLVLMVLMLTSVFNQISRAWSSGEGRIEDRRSARNLADFIGTELRGAVLPVETLAPTGKGNLQFLINPPEGQVPAEYRNADAIFWQAPIATDVTFGDIAEVGYFVRWLTPPTGTPQPVLCRYFVNPSIGDGENPGIKVVNPDFLIYHPANPNAWLTPLLLNKIAPADATSAYTGLFAENVVGLWIRSYGLDGKELPRNFDSRKGYPIDFTYTGAAGQPLTRREQRYLPSVVQVSLAQIDSRNLSRLAPVWEAVRTLTKADDIRDARQFLTRFQTDAESNAAYRQLLPALRIYSAEIQLENSR